MGFGNSVSHSTGNSAGDEPSFLKNSQRPLPTALTPCPKPQGSKRPGFSNAHEEPVCIPGKSRALK